MPLAQVGDGGGEETRDLGAEGGGDLRGPSEQKVAGQDGDQVPPTGVDTLDTTARERIIHDVVVIEGAKVHKLHRNTAHDALFGGRTVGGLRRGRVCGAQGQCRPEALATSGDQVAGDLGEEGVGGLDRPAQRILDSHQVVRQRRQVEQRRQTDHGPDDRRSPCEPPISPAIAGESGRCRACY